MKMRPYQMLFQLLISAFVGVQAFIDTNGICSVFVFVPLSILGLYDSGGLYFDNRTNYGFSHMAAALLAVEHFNNRDVTVVPELADELKQCNISLSLDGMFDTGSLTQMASQAFSDTTKIPCAIAGPFNDFPALELGVLAQANRFPLVVHRAFHPTVTSNFYHRYTTQVWPDMMASSQALVSYLRNEVKRTNYTALLYSLNDVNVYRRETLVHEFDLHGMHWFTSVYLTPLADDSSIFYTRERTPYHALQQIKKVGYRTIIVAMDSGYGTELEAIANAAEELDMNNGEYLWVWYDVFDFQTLIYRNTNVSKLVSGSAWMLPLNGNAEYTTGKNKFTNAWQAQGQVQVNRLNEANPIDPKQPYYKYAEPDFFQSVRMEHGSCFMYDAVMSIGMGACQAQKAAPNTNGTISGLDHVTGIRQSNFSGGSGPVQFGSNDEDRNGTRLASTVTWGILNIRPPNSNKMYETTHVLTPQANGTWLQVMPFVFASGKMEPPEQLRQEPNYNYLSQGLQILGLTLMSIAIAAALISALWVYMKRSHRVLVASQPVFLYLVCLGAIIQAFSIFTVSFDESYGWTHDQLSGACMATPWLLTLGQTMVYSALFTKMWRVHKVLQFQRRQIKVSHVAWPMFTLMVSDLMVLGLWTAFDPLYWSRTELNAITGDSIGECTCERNHYWVLVVVLILIPTCMTGYFAWKTKDVDPAYSESSYIFMMIFVQLEVTVVAAPVIVILDDVNTNGRYLGFCLLIWTFPMSALGFIILPKYIAYWKAIRGWDEEPQRTRRGERTSFRVSGINVHQKATTTSQRATKSNNSGASSNNSEQPMVSVVSQKSQEAAPSVLAATDGSASARRRLSV